MPLKTDPAALYRYPGTNPCPPDFEEFWALRMQEADCAPLEYTLSDAPLSPGGRVICRELRWRGIDGGENYAKFLLPAGRTRAPLILQFHGYPGASRSWAELASFAAMGYAVLAPDCPGQGGYSTDAAAYTGTAAGNHIVLGLEGDPKGLYYVKVHQNIALLCRILPRLEGIDPGRVSVNGGSQGGGLAIATAALHPELVKNATVCFPFLSDYQKVWELNADLIAYEGLRYQSRWLDPQGARVRELFTKLGYIDSINFAPLVRARVLMGTGMQDIVCPPITQFGVYNRLTCPKRHVLFPDYGHEEIQEFDDILSAFYTEEEERHADA